MDNFIHINFEPIEGLKWDPKEERFNYKSWKERNEERNAGWQKRIDEGGHVLLIEVYDALDLPLSMRFTEFDPYLWGWDKKGFRQLFSWKMELEKLD